MVGTRFLIRVFATGALLVGGMCACADSLRAEFSPLTLRPRTGAPASFDIKLHRAGAGLLEGALEITLEAGGDVILRQRTQDLTLAAGAQSFRLLTPPLPPHDAYSGSEARLRFIAKNGTVDLGKFPAGVSSRGTRNFVIAVCDGRGSGVRDTALWQSLRLESFFPAPDANNPFATSPVFLAPEDFPTNPLALFAFDLVLLDGDGFALLREKQLAALTRWIEAGGSLCLLPSRGLKDEHVRFLNGFASAQDPAPTVLPDTGEWRNNDAHPRLRQAGLGRVVIGSRPADGALATDEWKSVATFLWNFRGFRSDLDWPGHQRQTSGEFLRTLTPQSTRLIAPGAIALILGGFLLVVGPLDWFVLGVLRRRRWTWIVFPLASAGFTALVIHEAGRSLGHEDKRSALVVTDVGKGGRVLRENRFELLLAARHRESVTEVRNAFAVPTTFGGPEYYSRQSRTDPGQVRFSGQLPAHFTMHQPLRQWTPQFNRVTSLESAEAPDPAIPWAEIDTLLAAGGDVAKHLRKAIRPESGSLLYLFNGKARALASDETLALTREALAAVPAGILELCVRPKTGFASFFSRTAPDASADAGDLAIFDPRDPHEWLLVISRKTPNGEHLYRRLFRTNDP